MTPIITSLLDTDLYIWTMAQAVFHQYPNANVSYKFFCRSKGVKLAHLAVELKEEIDSWKRIRLSLEERVYLDGLGLFKSDFLDFMSSFAPNTSIVDIDIDENGGLIVNITGKWIDAIWIEVPLLATINELYSRSFDCEAIREEGTKRLKDKIECIVREDGFNLIEFGTRRRFSKDWQGFVTSELKSGCHKQLIGTSNVNLARVHGLKPIGTMAHCWISAHLGLVDNIVEAQKRAFHVWQQEYDDKLGVALTDTFTTKAFYRDFGVVLSKTFSGMRHDSGNPYDFANNCIEHYKRHGIDPQSKHLVFSDGLTINKAIDIWRAFVGKIGTSYGVGTSLSADMGGNYVPLSIVVKLIMCNGVQCVKLSDDNGKNTGDADMVKKVKMAYCSG